VEEGEGREEVALAQKSMLQRAAKQLILLTCF
jgi:hypothetical protein